MPNCFVKGCRNGTKKLRDGTVHGSEISTKKLRFFSTPKEEVLFNIWAKNIPINGMQLKVTSRVCEDHFQDHDIIKNDEFIIGGKIEYLPRIYWKLKSGAYPQIFPHNLSKVTTIAQKTRRAPLERKDIDTITNKAHCHSKAKPKARIEAITRIVSQPIQVEDKHLEASTEVAKDAPVETVAECKLPIPMEILQDKAYTFIPSEINNIILPSPTWKRGCFSINDGCINYFDVQENGKVVAIQKVASVDFKNCVFSQTIINREFTFEIDDKNKKFTSLSDVEQLLCKLHKSKICPGITNHPDDKQRDTNTCIVRNGDLVDGVWRAKKCSLLVSETGIVKSCKFCKLLDHSMKMQMKRRKTMKLNSKINHIFLSSKQLSQKLAAKTKIESQLKIRLKHKIAEIEELKAAIKAMRLKKQQFETIK